ncbi:MAG TPA: PAS domain S-box protein [Steroidobacteraceae bacterium]|jgi:PAS domain S-box-containing protein
MRKGDFLKRISKSAGRPARPKLAASVKSAPAHARVKRARPAKPDANIAGRLRFESFLLELSAYFAKAPADSVDQGIDEWLKKLGRFIGIDRINLWECEGDGAQMHRRHMYSYPGLRARPPVARSADFPWIIEQYRRGNIITWAKVPEDMPAAASAEITPAILAGAKSVLGIPIQAGSVLYVLSFVSVRKYRKWPRSLVRRLQLVGEIIASADARQRAERLLLASESSNRALLKALPDLIFVLDSNGVYAECHCPETIDLYLQPEQFLGKSLEEILPPAMARTFRGLFRRAAETGEVVEYEYVLPIAGQERHFEARMVRRDDGATITLVRNISERYRAASRLRDSEERFRAAFSHSAIGVALVSLDGRWLQVNHAICRLLGYSESELLASTFQHLTHPDDLEPDLVQLQRALAGEISHYEMEKRYIHKDGRYIWALLSVALVRNASNEPLYFVSQLQDLTQRRESQMEIDRARRELAHIGRVSLVGQLTSSLAHELLQPITAIVTNAETGLHAPDLGANPETRALFEDIAESGRRAGDIIQNVRGLLRKERRPHTVVDLNELVREVAHVMRSDLLVHQVRLMTRLDSGGAEIHGDRGELQQVLLNLMLNGTEAMNTIPIHERRLMITTAVRPDAVELRVEDKGTGSPPGAFERLLEPFFTTKSSGVGMGLSICSEIVRAHRGQLLAENNPDRGMTWCCVLPRD